LRVGGGDLSVLSSESNGLSIEVAQSMDVIREAEGGVALATLLPTVLLLSVLVLVIGFVIRAQIQTLDRAATAIAHRSNGSFEELPLADLLLEVRPWWKKSEIWDDGSGLPPQELERVFERFYRAPGDASNSGGSGLSTVDGSSASSVAPSGSRTALTRAVLSPRLRCRLWKSLLRCPTETALA
jgi:hypothetical protein